MLTHQEIQKAIQKKGLQKSSLLNDAEDLTEIFSRLEVAKVLQAYYASIADQGKVELELVVILLNEYFLQYFL